MDLINWQLSLYVSLTCTLTLFSSCEGWIHYWCRDPAVTMVSYNMQNLPLWVKIQKIRRKYVHILSFHYCTVFLTGWKKRNKQILPSRFWSGQGVYDHTDQRVFQSYLVYPLRPDAEPHLHIFFHFSMDPSMATMELTLCGRGPGNCPRASSSSGQYTHKQKWLIWVWTSHRSNTHGDM